MSLPCLVVLSEDNIHTLCYLQEVCKPSLCITRGKVTSLVFTNRAASALDVNAIFHHISSRPVYLTETYNHQKKCCFVIPESRGWA
jgi:hypothetical protein